MADLERMIDSARRAMVEVLELNPSDRVLVVQDPQCQKLRCQVRRFRRLQLYFVGIV
jgi:hypothetical protein